MGLGVSHTELAGLLADKGARVTVWDRKTREQLGDVVFFAFLDPEAEGTQVFYNALAGGISGGVAGRMGAETSWFAPKAEPAARCFADAPFPVILYNDSLAAAVGSNRSMVEDGETRFVPDRFAKTYLNWMENVHDWCISRQLWWGHQIPVWYCDDCGHMTVSRTDPTVCAQCGSAHIQRDPDVLDTWFSSALWPFSTLGWPEKTQDLGLFYPN